ncbi:histone deacetylase family protein [Orrella daihaiensis]|uniref:Histone deacetylase family protein n=1 Tax=Orrella daihaiensis TaxID=2782176 RepID=A0ABY4AK10_9BURK|nr:histone deacetylase family protein [Orrella daihaiensis]UOD49991.1 histone deacetylase family protein [Orrella daihaiensis]
MKTFYHPDQKLHHPQTYFSRGQMRAPQEVPTRVDGILQGLKNLGLTVHTPSDHGMSPITAVHDANYIEFLRSAHQQWKEIPEDWGDEVMSNIFVRHPNPLRGILGQAARYLADGSCPIGEHTWQSSYWAAQSAIAAASDILSGESKAYALCRPPGHHARYDAAGGFCYINHAAVAAELLKTKFKKIAILDTDMHHGQGIQEIFYQRDDVMYVSVHGDPTNFYPVVTGFEDEIGQGPGRGFNVNLPMPHGSDESFFFQQVAKAIQAIKRFHPDALVFSHGFDIYENDPQSKVKVTTDGFQRLGKLVHELNLPTVIIQEGGYDLASMTVNTERFFSGFLGQA